MLIDLTIVAVVLGPGARFKGKVQHTPSLSLNSELTYLEKESSELPVSEQLI